MAETFEIIPAEEQGTIYEVEIKPDEENPGLWGWVIFAYGEELDGGVGYASRQEALQAVGSSFMYIGRNRKSKF